MKDGRGEEAAEENLEAGGDRFMWFKEGSHLHGIWIVDVEAVANYVEDMGEIMSVGGYTKQQTLGVDKTAFCWKKMPPRTFIAREASAWLQIFKGQVLSY